MRAYVTCLRVRKYVFHTRIIDTCAAPHKPRRMCVFYVELFFKLLESHGKSVCANISRAIIADNFSIVIKGISIVRIYTWCIEICVMIKRERILNFIQTDSSEDT